MRVAGLILAGLLGASSTQSHAQGDPCFLGERQFFEIVAESFEGAWQVKNNGGHSFVDNRHGEIPGWEVDEPSALTVSDDGTRIILDSSNMPEPVDLRFSESLEINVAIETQIPDRLMTNEDLGTISGCRYSDLAHLDGFSSVEFGGEMTNVSYRLTILGENLIHGIVWTEGTWNGSPSWSRIEFSMTR